MSRIFIAGIIGALILSTGFYLMLSEFNKQQYMLDKLYPGVEKDIGPGGLFWGFLGIIIFVLSAYITGFIANLLTKNIEGREKVNLRGKTVMIGSLASGIIYSFAAGFIAGIITGFIFSIISTINELGISKPSILLTSILDSIIAVIPFFIIIALFFAFFSIFGGIFYELIFNIFKKYSGRNI